MDELVPRVPSGQEPAQRERAAPQGSRAEQAQLAAFRAVLSRLKAEPPIVYPRPTPAKSGGDACPDGMYLVVSQRTQAHAASACVPSVVAGMACKRNELPILPRLKSSRGAPALGSCVAVATLLRIYMQACDGGDALGCDHLGDMYEHGDGVAQDDAKAVDYLSRACNGGSAAACSDLGFYYERGKRVVDRDADRAAALYKQACDGGSGLGCMNLGVTYDRSGDAAQAVKLYQRGCNDGTADACASLARSYGNGSGVPLDEHRAAELMKRACDWHDADACDTLARVYVDIGRDHAHAAKLRKQACESLPEACNALGLQYQDGHGVPKDLAQAIALFTRACDHGALAGCSNLGRMHEEGKGTARNLTQAVALYKKACAGGRKWSCKRLKLLQAGAADSPAKPTARPEAAGEAPRTPERTLASFDDYVAASRLLVGRMTEVFKSAGASCDKLADGLTRLMNDRELIEPIRAYERAHPDAKDKIGVVLKDEIAAVAPLATPAVNACKNNPRVRDAVARFLELSK